MIDQIMSSHRKIRLKFTQVSSLHTSPNNQPLAYLTQSTRETQVYLGVLGLCRKVWVLLPWYHLSNSVRGLLRGISYYSQAKTVLSTLQRYLQARAVTHWITVLLMTLTLPDSKTSENIRIRLQEQEQQWYLPSLSSQPSVATSELMSPSTVFCCCY